MNGSVYLPLIVLVFLSGWSLWFRYSQGRLLTPVSGLHLQIFIFFGLGGLAFVFFPYAEPKLNTSEIFDETVTCSWPLICGYAVVVLLEYCQFRKKPDEELALKQAPTFPGAIVWTIALIGLGGYALASQDIAGGFLAFIAYCQQFFFPALFLALLCAFYRASSSLTAILLLVLATMIAVFTAWRSVLILLVCTVTLVGILKYKRWSIILVLLTLWLMGYLIPFQSYKKANYDIFLLDPWGMIEQNLHMDTNERIGEIGNFAVIRIDYLRELVYVQRALEEGMPLSDGATYKNMIYQLIPRVFWLDKPEMANQAGFEFPRRIGLLDQNDPLTSWSVNMFAEAVSNFGLWCLVWFVPLSFSLAEGMERLAPRLYRTSQAVLMTNVVLFYLFLDQTTVIFFISVLVALLGIIKVIDVSMLFLAPTALRSDEDASRRGRLKKGKERPRKALGSGRFSP